MADVRRQVEAGSKTMTYIVNEACIKCKYMDCVEVCPVDCFYEGENMLVIHPDECIDCGVCEPECPPEAILPDTDPGADDWRHQRLTPEARCNLKFAQIALHRQCVRTYGLTKPPRHCLDLGNIVK